MKTKKLCIGVLVASLLVSLSLLCFSGFNLIAKAEGTTSSTVDSIVDEEVSAEITTKEDINNTIKDWVGLIFSISNTGLGALLLALVSKKKEQPVAVTVNDAETQEQLKTIQTENAQLRNLVTDMFQLQKGTFEVLKTVFAENTGFDERIRNTIKDIVVYEEDIIKDFDDILNSENHKKAKTALKNISNIILG
jgi:hypothetical protein